VTANVRCVGAWHGDGFQCCGWKGERFPTVPITMMAGIAKADFERKVTAKPCPRCGGQVQLIPTDGAS